MSSSKDDPFPMAVVVGPHANVQFPAGVQRAAPAAGFTIRRGLAVVLSLIGPGFGHFYLDDPKRAAAWLSCHIVLALATITGIHFGWRPTLPLALPALLLVRLAAGLDTLRSSRPTQLPRVPTALPTRIGILLAVLLIGHGLRTSLLEAFQIPSAAMYPTLEVGDHIFVEKLDRNFQPGDVVVFHYPPDPEVMYMKRMVARGGDRVELRKGVLIVNDSPAPTTRTTQRCAASLEAGGCTIWEEAIGGHRYRIARTHFGDGMSFGPVVVPEGQVFMLGDNRDNSSDSRIWGGVDEELLVGKLKAIWLSSGPDGIRWSRFNLQIR